MNALAPSSRRCHVQLCDALRILVPSHQSSISCFDTDLKQQANASHHHMAIPVLCLPYVGICSNAP